MSGKKKMVPIGDRFLIPFWKMGHVLLKKAKENFIKTYPTRQII